MSQQYPLEFGPWYIDYLASFGSHPGDQFEIWATEARRQYEELEDLELLELIDVSVDTVSPTKGSALFRLWALADWLSTPWRLLHLKLWPYQWKLECWLRKQGVDA